MGVPKEHALTEEDIARLKSVVRKPGDHKITEIECEKIRTEFRQGTRRAKLEERFDVDSRAIRHHVTGRCTCETDCEPVETVKKGKYRHLICWEDGCTRQELEYDKMTTHWHIHHKGESR